MKQGVIVLGADGYVGKELVSALQVSSEFTPTLIDVTNADGLRSAMQRAQAVVNCVTGDVKTLLTAADAIAQCVPGLSTAPRVLHLSTMSVYGSTSGVVSESTPLPPDLPTHPAAEARAETIVAACPKVVIFRPARVFGPGSEQATLRIARLLVARRLGDLGEAGDGYCNLVHVGDVVQALVRALQKPAVDGAVFNLGLAHPPTWNEFLVKFGVALGAIPVGRITSRRLRIEENLLAAPLKMLEMLTRALGVDPRALPGPMPSSFLNTMRQEILLDTRRAETELGMRWKGLASMLDEAARSVRGEA
jgi:2-alkyl-3-oxoalkanoate reductase